MLKITSIVDGEVRSVLVDAFCIRECALARDKIACAAIRQFTPQAAVEDTGGKTWYTMETVEQLARTQ